MKRPLLIACALTTAIALRVTIAAEPRVNGLEYLECVLGSEDFKARVAKSKFREMPLFAKSNAGYIAPQGDHGAVSFRNILIRPIEGKN